MNATSSGIVYDAQAVSRILDLPCKCRQLAPQAGDGEIIIYYGGWDLPTLRDSRAGQDRVKQDQDWYDDKRWKAKAGYYRVVLRVGGSNNRTWHEQVQRLKHFGKAWKPAPITVAATALLVHLTETGKDLLSGDWCRCAEEFRGCRAEITALSGYLFVAHAMVDGPNYCVWLAACQRF